MPDNRLTASSPELELAFIASAIYTAAADAGPVVDVVTDACFTRPTLAAAWRAIVEAWGDGQLPDPILVAARAAETSKADGGQVLQTLLAAMSSEVAASYYLRQRADALVDLKIRRELVAFGAETVRDAVNAPDLSGLLAATTRYAEALDDLRAREETGLIGPIAEAAEIEAENGGGRGLSSGIAEYDAWSGGMRAGEVHVLAGPTGVGKTWLAGQLANAALDAGQGVAVFSLEMSAREMYVRLLAGRIGLIAYRLLGRGRTWDEQELADYRRERAILESGLLRLYTSQRNVADIGAVVRASRPAVIVVDYVQLLETPAGCRPGYEATTENANALQRLAIRADCCAVVVTQMSREAIKAGPSSPVLGGQDSGRVDHIAHFWCLISPGDTDGIVQLHNRKSRHGTTGGSASFRLDGRTGRLVRA